LAPARPAVSEKQPASSPTPAAGKSGHRIEIEPVESEFGKILKRPGE
jgi:hypothetical protein